MYTTVIHPLRVAYQLSPNEYFVLDAIYHLSHSEKNGYWCTMSQSELADKLQFSRQWVNSCMQKLLTKGLIKFRKNTTEQLAKSPKQDTAVRTTDEWNEWHDPMNDKYLMFLKSESVELITGNMSLMEQVKAKYAEHTTPQKRKSTPVNSLDTPCQQTGHPLSTHLTPPVNKPDTILTYTNNNINTPYSPPGDVTGWERFWSTYPKKVGKLFAQRAWNKLTPTDQEAALAVLPSHIRLPQWTKDDGQFIPNPATWLNQRRWEDTLPPISPPPLPIKYKTPEEMMSDYDTFIQGRLINNS